MLIARRNIPGQHALPLILRQLVVTIWRLKPVSSSKKIEVYHIICCRLPIESIENAATVTPIVNRKQLRRVEKMARSDSIGDDKVSEFGSAKANRSAAAPGSKGAPIGRDGAEWFCCAEA